MSCTEGVSQVTAFAPELCQFNQATTSIYWIDAQWIFPASVVAECGKPHVLTTTVFRRTNGTPLAGWVVRYTVGSGGSLGYEGGNTVDVADRCRGTGERRGESVGSGRWRDAGWDYDHPAAVGRAERDSASGTGSRRGGDYLECQRSACRAGNADWPGSSVVAWSAGWAGAVCTAAVDRRFRRRCRRAGHRRPLQPTPANTNTTQPNPFTPPPAGRASHLKRRYVATSAEQVAVGQFVSVRADDHEPRRRRGSKHQDRRSIRPGLTHEGDLKNTHVIEEVEHSRAGAE